MPESTAKKKAKKTKDSSQFNVLIPEWAHNQIRAYSEENDIPQRQMLLQGFYKLYGICCDVTTDSK